jgi:RHS repeat-associated protein
LVSLAIVLAAWFALGWSSTLAAERVYFYHTDAAGTPLAITNTNGQVVWETDYLPFGEPSTVTAQIKNTTMFAGKEHDSETGLYDFGARYLAADVGRFFAPDPVRAVDPVTSQVNSLLLQNPQRLNLYAYGLNNPYRFIDPDGNIVWDIVDFAFFSYSYYRFVDDPSLSTGTDFALDGIGLLPVVPALGTIKRVGQEGLEQVAKLGAQRAVTKSADDWVKLSGQLRDASKGKGNFGIGSGTREQANAMGKAWVGEGYKVASDGKTLISKDWLRQYRPPSVKPNSLYATTGVQANFERRLKPEGQWHSNAHLDIID